MSSKMIRSIVLAAVASFSAVSFAAGDEDGEGYEFDRLYVGASGTLVIPQGGCDMRRLGGATARIGYYVSESFAVEADAAWLEDCAGLGVQGLWHFWGY